MTYRVRLLLLGMAMVLTSLVLDPRAQASECDEGTVLWYDAGCCVLYSSFRQNALRCDGGTWVGTSGYRCISGYCQG